MTEEVPRRERWRRFIAVSLVGGVALALLLLAVGAGLQYSDQSSVCGDLCHDIMAPQYTAYQSGSHARVPCVECHVGPGLPEYIQGKIILISQGWKALVGGYPRPIPSPIGAMRPSRDICETCHWPEKFYQDRVHEIVRFAEDEANTETRRYLLMKTGGPHSANDSPAIHWHIKSEVLYIPADEQASAIPWVAVKGEDGNMTTYMSTENPLSSEQVREATMVRADCVLCHNRATHAFSLPQEAMDEMLATGRIDASLPFIKKKGVELLTAPYQDRDEAMAGLATLKDYYREQYPEVFAQKETAIEEAVTALQETYRANVFPEMGVTWGTYPDYLSHEGCFRCHDGKHAAAGGTTISQDCNTCHELLSSLVGGG